MSEPSISAYLDLPRRSLEELACDYEREIVRLQGALRVDDAELRERVQDRVIALQHKIRAIDEEIAHRNERAEGSYGPVVL